jgi:hypothetical protein
MRLTPLSAVTFLALLITVPNKLLGADPARVAQCDAQLVQADLRARQAGNSADRHATEALLAAIQKSCVSSKSLSMKRDAHAIKTGVGIAVQDATAGFPVSTKAANAPESTQCPSGASGFSGRVFDAASNAGLGSGLIGVYNSNGLLQKFVVTDTNGNYSATGLLPGRYFAATSTSSFEDYLAEAHANLPCPTGFAQTSIGLGSCTPSNSTAIVVTAGNVLPNINFALSKDTGFSGRVTDVATGGALSSGLIGIYNSVGLLQKFVGTDKSGNYQASGLLPGNYYAATSTTSFEDYLAEGYLDVACPSGFAQSSLGLGSCTPATLTAIVVPAGTIVQNINFALSQSAGFSGRVTDGVSGAGLSFGLVGVYNSAGLLQKFASTDGNGDYRASGLLPGNHFAATSTTSFEQYLAEAHSDLPCPSGFAQISLGVGSCTPANSTPIAVTTNSIVPNINFALSKNTGFTGRVIDAATGAGLGFGLVGIYNATGLLQKFVATNANGDYRATGLLAGNHYAATSTSSFDAYLAEAHQDLACPTGFAAANLGVGSCSPSNATAIAVPASSIIPNINFALSNNNGIGGRVTDAASGVGLSFGLVGIYNANGLLQKFAVTDANGDYRARGLLPGNHYAATSATSFENYLAEVHQNIACPTGFAQSNLGLGSCSPANATAITVSAALITPNIDFGLCRLESSERIFANGFEN